MKDYRKCLYIILYRAAWTKEIRLHSEWKICLRAVREKYTFRIMYPTLRSPRGKTLI
jgi:hypothetical protein